MIYCLRETSYPKGPQHQGKQAQNLLPRGSIFNFPPKPTHARHNVVKPQCERNTSLLLLSSLLTLFNFDWCCLGIDNKMKELVPSLLLMVTAILAILAAESQAAAPSRVHLPKVLNNNAHSRHPWVVVPRGGSVSDEYDSEEYDSDDEEEEEEEEDIIIEDDEDEYDSDEEEKEDIVMVNSAVKATQKTKAKKTAAVKETVSAKLSVKKPKKPSLVKRFVPYIVRACFNPFTVMTMTKAYFASLFNLDYLAEVCDLLHMRRV